MQNELNLKYTQLKCQSKEQVEMDEALAAFHHYKGKCANCRKFGHKLMECHSKSVSMKKEDGSNTQNSKKGKGNNKKHIMCFHCGKKGHYKSKCPDFKEEEEEMDVTNLVLNGQGIVLMMASPTVQLPPTMWIADSSASTHITNEECGLYKKRCINKPISLGNGKVIHATIVSMLDIALWMLSKLYTQKRPIHPVFLRENF